MAGEPSDTWQILILVIFLILSGFFSSAETALMSLSKMRLRHLVDEGVKNAKLVSSLIEDPKKLLGAILIGNNIVNIGASSLATSIAMIKFDNAGVGIATGIMTFLILVFGEITPKSIATKYCEEISLKIAKPMYILTVVLGPIVTVLTGSIGFVLRIFGLNLDEAQPTITEDELKTIVNVSQEEGVLEGEEKEMIFNVFDFGDNKVSDVMTPRINMIAADINSTYEELIEIFKNETFSRIPIYEESQDNIVGILHVKDLIFVNNKEKEFSIREYMRQPFFTYEFMNSAELFAEMRKNKTSMAIVLDEYGSTEGIITIEDLVEEIVGEIDDEYDLDENEIKEIKEREYVVEGSTRIDLINETIGLNIETEEFDSIGGYIIGILGRLPEKGEAVEYENIKFVTENIEKNRVEKLRIIL